MSDFEDNFIENGRYRLQRLLGSGGMARVFLVQDTKLDVQRAIKVIRPDISNSKEARKRMFAEAKIMANLNHPNIVTIHDIIDNNAPYIVMEYLSGGSLLDLLEQHGPLSPGQAAQFLVPICHAVEHAHQAGVIHRDIKPHNILLSKNNQAKITDFGIARITSQFSETKTGDIVGTPSYMSPEQRLSARRVTPLSDVYSIGATFFVLLCAGNPSELYDEELQKDLMLKLSPEAKYIIQKSCAFSSENRFQSAFELAEALSKLVNDEPLPRFYPSSTEEVSENIWQLWEEFTQPELEPKKDSSKTIFLNEQSGLQIEMDTLDYLSARETEDKPEEKYIIEPQEVALVDSIRKSEEEPVPEPDGIVKSDTDSKVLNPNKNAVEVESQKQKYSWRWSVGAVGLCSILYVLSAVIGLSIEVSHALNVLSLCGGVAALTALLLGKTLSEQRNWLHEAGFILFALVITGTLGAFYSAPQLLGIPFFETDFIDYCVSITHFDTVELAPPKRSNVAAWLPAVLARDLGVIDGLAMGALISCALTGLGIHLWGRAVGGPLAGIFALGIALGLAPIVGLSRFLNFYPEIIATFTLAAAATAIAIRTRHAGAVLAAGVLSCLCVLIDLRGLIWFLPLSFGVLIAIIGMRTWKDRLSSLCGLVGIYAFSWRLGRWSYHELATPLERQIDVRPLFSAFDLQSFPPPYTTDSAFVWGRSAISEIPQTLSFLWAQRNIEPPAGFLSADTGMTMLQPFANGWAICLIMAGLCCLTLLFKHRWRLLALFVPCVPFAVALVGAQELVEPHLRFFAHALPGVVVVLGVAMVGLVRYLQSRGGPSQLNTSIRLGGTGVLFAILWLLILKPTVDWHPNWPIQRHIYLSVLEKAFPERRGFIRTQPASVGRENHVHVLPLTRAERALAHDYDLECAVQLKRDQTLTPWLYSSSH